jgi:hypothetical protein
MSVTLSLFAGAGAQFLDNSGNVLTGGKIYTYNAGTTTPLATYTSNLGTAAHPNPIILDASGRIPGGELWLSNGFGYKFVTKDANDVLIGTYDNIPSSAQPPIVNDASSISYEQGYTVTAGGFIIGDTYRITSLGTTNFQTIGASANTVGTFFVATGVGSGTGTAQYSNTVQTKLQEYISVADFGAVGNGIADDTVAIQAALNTAGPRRIHFPKGHYLISSPLTFYSSILIGDGFDQSGSGTPNGVVLVAAPSMTGYILQTPYLITSPSNPYITAQISNISFFGNAGKTASGINWGGVAENSSISNCKFYGLDVSVQTGDYIGTVPAANVTLSLEVNSCSVYDTNTAFHFIGALYVTYLNNVITDSCGKVVHLENGGFTTHLYITNFHNEAPKAGATEVILVDNCDNSFVGIKSADFSGNNAANNLPVVKIIATTASNYPKIAMENISMTDSGTFYLVDTLTSTQIPRTAGGQPYPRIYHNVNEITTGQYGFLQTDFAKTLYADDFSASTLIESCTYGAAHVIGQFSSNPAYGIQFYAPSPDATTFGQAINATANSSYKLWNTVNPFTSPSTSAFFSYRSNDLFIGVENTTGVVSFRTSNTDRCGVDANGHFRPDIDNTYSCGTSARKWSVIYATSGTINTSDANQKTDIVDISDVEKRVAVKLKSSMKRFKFKNGDRYHFGTIAQDVKVAFESEGLIAEEYGVFCSDTLEDGTVQLGIRYDELFAFIISAI